MLRFLLAVLAVFVAICIVSEGSPRAASRPASRATQERKSTVYPGTCPNGESWYLVDSSDTTATLGCYDPDYSEPDSN